MSRKLTVKTDVGEFTRGTDMPYTHVVVWDSPKLRAGLPGPYSLAYALAGRKPWGAGARIAKDRGYGTSWHRSKAAAEKAVAKGYGGRCWANDATLVGIFEVDFENKFRGQIL